MKDWTQQQRNCFYKTQDVHIGDHRVTTDRCGWLKTMHKKWKPTSYLDLACRDGFVTRSFLDDGCRITGVDICTEAIQIAREEAKRHFPACFHRSRYIEADLETYYPKDSFDCVVCFEFIEHVPEKFVMEMFIKMTCASKRLCAISTPNKYGKFGEKHNTEDRGHINLYDSERLERDIKLATGCQPTLEITPDFLYAWWEVEQTKTHDKTD